MGIGLVLHACGDGMLRPDDPADVPFDAVASSSASLSFGDATGPTTFYCNVVTREADGTFRRKTHRFVLPPRFSTPGLESELRFFEQRYSNGAARQKAVCDLPVHGFAFAMVQARLHGGNRNRSVEPYDPWQRRLLGLEVASLPERAEIQAASIGFFLTLTSRALQQVFVTNDPLDVDCDGEWEEVEPGMFDDGYDYEGYWYCDGVVALDGMEVQALDDGPNEEDPNWYIWPDFELPDPPPGPSCCGGGPGDPGDPPPDDEECDPELDTCDPCNPDDEICDATFDLSCNDAVRGDPVTCTITGSTSQVTEVEWHFSGSGFSVSRPVGTQMTWSGTAVVGGTVTATVSYDSGTEEEPLTADFSVTPRNWSIPASNLTKSVDPAFESFLGQSPPSAGNEAGGWCQRLGCIWEQPYLEGTPVGGAQPGFKVTEVTAGPNDGSAFISAVGFRGDAVWALHPEISPTATTTYSFSNASVSCLNKNWWAMNKCLAPSVSESTLTAFRAGVMHHETDGTHGYGAASPNGHDALAQKNATDPQFDPYQYLEEVVGSDAAALRSLVATEIEDRMGDLTTANRPRLTLGPNHFTGNFSADIWFKDGSGWSQFRTSGDTP